MTLTVEGVYEPVAAMRKDVARAVRASKASPDEARQLVRFYASGQDGYTSLDEP
jgi:hypothetical protein